MPTSEELYNEADRLKGEGRLDEAAAKFNELLAHDPSYALAHAALAVVYGRLGQHEKAVEHAQRVVQLEPRDAFSYTALSVTYQRAFAGTREQHYIALAEEAMARARMMQGG
jgi:tetratricopeptide (TPR) repeat protein